MSQSRAATFYALSRAAALAMARAWSAERGWAVSEPSIDDPRKAGLERFPQAGETGEALEAA